MQIKKQILKSALLGILAVMLLNFPFILIADKIILVASVPVLYIYVFGIWLLLILVMFFLMDKKRSKNKKTKGE